MLLLCLKRLSDRTRFVSNGNWWFLRLQWPFGFVFACLWKQKWGDFSAGKCTWEVTTFGDRISAKEGDFQQKPWNLSSRLGRCSEQKWGVMCGQCYCQGQSSWHCEMLRPSACMRVTGSQFCKPMQAVLKEFATMGQWQPLEEHSTEGWYPDHGMEACLWYCNSTSCLAYGKALVTEFLPGTVLHLGQI